ncbi:hypothetical protein THAOC_37489 [Thalassiosira oceanica]|uniref:Uncharacterized protein n=1 Tax=Thalassiosira oceanica TaxID=159749 RepID=K0RBT7_THAOC|nr:hypothetical protein THAOC_37489 [Thalassiosira oceanica]|eukprot:EJK44012.1 hypothetical protein THAOC_37489 [Thalassiosira oceanica]
MSEIEDDVTQSSSCSSSEIIEGSPTTADTVNSSVFESFVRSVADKDSVGLTHVNSSVTWDGPEVESQVSTPSSHFAIGNVGQQLVANPMSNGDLVSTSAFVAKQVLASTVNTVRANYEAADQLSQQLIFPKGNEAALDGMQHPMRCDLSGVQDTSNMNNMLQNEHPQFARALEPAMLPKQHEDNALALMRRREGSISQQPFYQTSKPGRYEFSSPLPAPIQEEKSILGKLYESDTFDSECGPDQNYSKEDRYAAHMRR